MAKTIKIPSGSKIEFFGHILELLNILQPERDKRITQTEKELLAAFFILDPKKFRFQRFSRLAKKKVIELFQEKGQILTKENLNFKLYRLIDKGYLVRDEDNIVELKGYLNDLLYEAYECLEKNNPLVVNIHLIARKDYPNFEETNTKKQTESSGRRVKSSI